MRRLSESADLVVAVLIVAAIVALFFLRVS